MIVHIVWAIIEVLDNGNLVMHQRTKDYAYACDFIISAKRENNNRRFIIIQVHSI